MSYDINQARDLLLEAQAKMQEAIDALSAYVDLTGDRNTEAYILDHLRTMTSSDHPFLSRDRNLDDVIAELAEDEELFDGDEDEYEEWLAEVGRHN